MQVWDATNGNHLYTYQGHVAEGKAPSNLPLGTVRALAWSPDSTHIASASQDNAVRVWRVP